MATEFIAKGFHADILQQLVACQLIFMEKVHYAEATMIGVNNPYPIIEGDDHMVMGAGAGINRSLFKIEFPQILGQRLLPRTVKRPVMPRCTSR